MDSCDLTVVVSPVEADLLRRDGVDTVRVIPNVHQVPDGWLSPRGRRDLLFVGGFRHTPNGDAVRWFVHEILPLVRHAHPDVVLNVIGSHVTDDVRALESANVRIHGWVRTIEPHYASARAMVAPLRFGAGVKGKVGEALALGVPSVLTTVAAEGMHVRDGTHALVADDAAAFAGAVVRILDDDGLWASLSTAGRDLVRERFGPETTRRSLAEVLMAPRRAERAWA
jgi:glycosyltransferase involved in cell wall biosynthesis